jgi:hypothetical protein
MGFWHNRENQKMYFMWLAEQLGIETQHDWYSLKLRTVLAHGGSGLLDQFSYSLYKALRSVFPGIYQCYIDYHFINH